MLVPCVHPPTRSRSSAVRSSAVRSSDLPCGPTDQYADMEVGAVPIFPAVPQINTQTWKLVVGAVVARRSSSEIYLEHSRAGTLRSPANPVPIFRSPANPVPDLPCGPTDQYADMEVGGRRRRSSPLELRDLSGALACWYPAFTRQPGPDLPFTRQPGPDLPFTRQPGPDLPCGPAFVHPPTRSRSSVHPPTRSRSSLRSRSSARDLPRDLPRVRPSQKPNGCDIVRMRQATCTN